MIARINLAKILDSELVLVMGSFILIGYTIGVTCCLFKNSILEKILWTAIYYIILVAAEMIAVAYIGFVMGCSVEQIVFEGRISEIGTISSKGMAFLTIEFFIRKEKEDLKIGYDYFRIVLAIIAIDFIFTLSAIYMIVNKEYVVRNINLVILLIVIMTFLLSFLTLLSIFIINKKSKEQLESTLKLQQIEAETKFNEDMIGVVDSLRKLRHDMNNHIALMKGLVMAKQYDELESYLEEVHEDIQVANEIIVTDNRVLSVVLNTKKNNTKEMGIEFNPIVGFHHIYMSNKDLCSLLGNILDNAIEAAVQVHGSRYIDFTMQKIPDGYMIKCENPYAVDPIVKKGRFISIKKDVHIHGIGTENIKDIVKKYGGHVRFSFDENVFQVKVILPKSI